DRVDSLSVPNRGPGRARNLGLARARGRLVAFLGADDRWLPRKLQRQVRYLERYPTTALLHTETIVSAEPDHAASAAPDRHPLNEDGAPPALAFAEVFHGDRDVNTLTVMAPRAVIEEAGGFDERPDLHVEDWDLWLRIAATHPVGYLPI